MQVLLFVPLLELKEVIQFFQQLPLQEEEVEVQEIHLQEHQTEDNQVDQAVAEVRQILLVTNYFLEQVILLQLVQHKVFQGVKVT